MDNKSSKSVTVSIRFEQLLGWGIIVVVTLIPVVLWWVGRDDLSWRTLSDSMRNIGLISGIVGTVLYALSLVLMTRLRVLEYLFGGLNRVYITHHIVGGLSLLAVLVHPVTLGLGMVENSLRDAALLFIPNGLSPLSALFNPADGSHYLVLEQWARFMGILGYWLMLGLLLVTIFITLPYRVWLITHKFLGLVFVFIGLHIFYIQSDTSSDAILRWYVLGAVIIGLIAFIYKTLMGQILIRKYQFTVEGVYDFGAGIYRLYLSPLKGRFSYKAGQFVFLRLLNAPNMSREWHPFSISSNQASDQYLELSIKSLGDYTSKLLSVPKGVIAEVEGAYGKFSYANFANRDQVWIAGGIGITPFLSMVKDLPKEGYRVYLFYSVKSRSELIDWQFLYDEMTFKSTSFRVIPFIVDEQSNFLDVNYIETTCGSLPERDFYLCGPAPMMQSLKKQLRERGIPSVNIHSEEFTMS